MKSLLKTLIVLVVVAVAPNVWAQSATVNYGTTIATGNPNVFGVVGFPCNGSCVYETLNFNYPGSVNMQLTLINHGATFVRLGLHTSQLIPSTTVAAYRSAMTAGCPTGSVCNPATWHWNGAADTDGQMAEQVKALGLKTVLTVGEPLSWNGNGYPADFTVFNDIVKKLYQHFSPDVVSVWNEPENSGISTAQYGTIYQNAAAAIRSVNGSVPIGGPATASDCGGSDGSSCWAGYVSAMYATTPASSINFLDWHNYAGATFVSTMKTLAQQHGIPYYVNEWNEGSATNLPANGDSTDSVSFVGFMLASLLNNGASGSTYYAGHYYYDQASIYGFSSPTSGNLLKKAETWLLMAEKLGLGAGNSSVKSSSQSGLSAVMGAINSTGHPVVVLVNHTGSPVTANLTLNGLSDGSTSFQAFLADHGNNDATTPISSGNINISSGTGTLSASMSPFSVEGVILGATSPTPTPTPSPSPTPGASNWVGYGVTLHQ